MTLKRGFEGFHCLLGKANFSSLLRLLETGFTSPERDQYYDTQSWLRSFGFDHRALDQGYIVLTGISEACLI